MSAPIHEQHVSTDTLHDAVDEHADAHAATGGHGHGDVHGQAPLGPIDWPAWGMALAGGVLAVIVSVALVLAAHP